MKEKLKFIAIIVILIALVAVTGVLIYNGVSAMTSKTVNPVATFEIKDYGNVKIELYPEYAPNTVSNIITLIESGYYNDKVIYGKDELCLYMAKDNSEESKGPTISLIDSSIEAGSENDYEYEIDGEFVSNGFEQNTLRYEKGIVSLNRSDYSSYGLVEEGYNSGSAKFSVMMTEASELNGLYCGFGRVIEGLEILEKIYNETEIKQDEEEQTQEATMKEFATMPVITNASVEKNGVDFGKPEVHEKFDIQAYINELYSQYYSN